MAGSLDTKVAIITGSGKGLGKAIAQLFAAEGATVVISDIDAVAAEKTAESIPGASAIACDVRDEDQVKALVEQTVDQHGGLHVMVANAGVGTAAPLLEIDLEVWRRVTSVNLDGVFLTIRYAAPAIIASGGGSIVTLSSVTATAGTPLLAHYAAAKAAVLNLTKTAAIELGPRCAGQRAAARRREDGSARHPLVYGRPHHGAARRCLRRSVHAEAGTVRHGRRSRRGRVVLRQ